MAKAMDLIFSILNVASAREVPFTIPLYMQYILYGLTTALLCVPFIFVHHEKCQFCGRHIWLPFVMEIILVAILITKVLFKQLLIRTAAQRAEHSW